MDINEFKKELKALLHRHNATIGFECSQNSDTYSIFSEKMVVYVGDDNKNYTICDGWGFDQSDIDVEE